MAETIEAPAVASPGPQEIEGDQSTSLVQSTALTSDMADLDALPREHQELAITRMLDQSKQWLDRAMEATNPAREVAEFKAFVATVAEAAKQKKLSEGIQLDAVEMVRRAERALGVAIRKGQGSGDIAKRGDIGGRSGLLHHDPSRSSNQQDLDKPTDFASMHELSNTSGGIYDLTDGVTDDDFNAALAEAKEEGNLSRANVVRNVKRKTRPEQQSSDLAYIREHADSGMLSGQIAEHLGLSEAWVRRLARDNNITIRGDEVMRGKHRIRPAEVMENIVTSLEGDQSAIDLIAPHIKNFTPEQAVAWLVRAEEPMQALRRMVKQLKEITDGHA